MVRGRLAARERQAGERRPIITEERARRLVEREFNLSYMDAPPGHNTLAAGRWFEARRRARSRSRKASPKTPRLEARRRAYVHGRRRAFSARITSLRKLRWDSMKVNFFVIAPPQLLADLPTSYISAFRVAARAASRC